MGELNAISTRSIAGGAAGALTLTGIKLRDKLISVVDTEAPSANLASEFTITAADTINNTGGTNTTGKDLLVVWERYAGGRADERFTSTGGRSSS